MWAGAAEAAEGGAADLADTVPDAHSRSPSPSESQCRCRCRTSYYQASPESETRLSPAVSPARRERRCRHASDTPDFFWRGGLKEGAAASSCPRGQVQDRKSVV